MSETSRRLLAPATALLWTAAAAAWGPYTHAIVNQAAADRLPDDPAFVVLRDPARAELFVRAGSAADLVFSVLAGGKTDPDLNRVLHQPAFHAYLLARCRAAGDLACEAFAFGLSAHLSADRAGNTPGSVTATNLFGWPEDTDVFGRPVDDPGASAAAQLRAVTVGINKIVVDALVRREQRREARYDPFVPADDLAEALVSYGGPDALPAGTPAERAEIRERIPALKTRFQGAMIALRSLATRIYRSDRLRRPLEEAFGGGGYGVPGIEESADAALRDLRVLSAGGVPGMPDGVPGGPGPAATADVPPGGAPAGHAGVAADHGHPHGAKDACLSALSAGARGALGAALGLARLGSEAALRVEQRVLAPGEDAAAGDGEPRLGPLPATGAGGRDAAEAVPLSGLRAEIMKRFATQLMIPRRSWGDVRDAVRGLVPASRTPEPGRVRRVLDRLPRPGIPDFGDLFRRD